MITNFLIVPSHWTELLYWGGAGFFITASVFRFIEIHFLRRSETLFNLKIKELEAGIETVQRDARTLSREIEEVRKLKLPD